MYGTAPSRPLHAKATALQQLACRPLDPRKPRFADDSGAAPPPVETAQERRRIIARSGGGSS